MKRMYRIIIICFLFGICTSVMVAVASMLWGPFPDLSETQPRITLTNWPRAVPADWPPPTARTTYSNAVYTLVLHQTIQYADAATDSITGATHYQWLYQYGWPARAFEAESRITADKPHELYAALGPVPSWFRPGESSLRHVPTRPIWTGLLIDSLLYAVLLWSLLAGLYAAKRSSHLKRGLCPTCKYNLRGDITIGCPECGWGREEL